MRTRTNATAAAGWVVAVLALAAVVGVGARSIRDAPTPGSALASPTAAATTQRPTATPTPVTKPLGPLVLPSPTPMTTVPELRSIAAFFEPAPAYPGYGWTRNGAAVVTGYELTVAAGPEHCHWQRATFLTLGWPPGAVSSSAAQARQYIRDPHSTIDRQRRPALAQFEPRATLPADAKATGYRFGPLELYLAPSDQDRFVYIVGFGSAERWPRSEPMTLCV